MHTATAARPCPILFILTQGRSSNSTLTTPSLSRRSVMCACPIRRHTASLNPRAHAARTHRHHPLARLLSEDAMYGSGAGTGSHGSLPGLAVRHSSGLPPDPPIPYHHQRQYQMGPGAHSYNAGAGNNNTSSSNSNTLHSTLSRGRFGVSQQQQHSPSSVSSSSSAAAHQQYQHQQPFNTLNRRRTVPYARTSVGDVSQSSPMWGSSASLDGLPRHHHPQHPGARPRPPTYAEVSDADKVILALSRILKSSTDTLEGDFAELNRGKVRSLCVFLSPFSRALVMHTSHFLSERKPAPIAHPLPRAHAYTYTHRARTHTYTHTHTHAYTVR